jgi:hypothetical protein
VHPDQGAGRWDNPDLYRLRYVATSPEAAVGEAFAHLTAWRRAMLVFPQIPGALRHLGVYGFDEEAFPLLDLDDAVALRRRGLRPTDVVIRNRPATQDIARRIYEEGRWSGIRWWSLHRPQWTLFAIWADAALVTEAVESLVGHPALVDAALRLAKPLAADLS